jgi:hypothetical protein
MRRLLLLALFIPFHCAVLAGDLSYDCHGQTRFVHRGAPSTYPVDEKRSYLIANNQLEGMTCEPTEKGFACFGLTAHQAMRRVQIDTAAKSVSDKLELPTSELIFEGHCD